MNINRSGYYKWLRRKGTYNRYEANRKILNFCISDCHHRYPSYGYHDIASVVRKNNELDFYFSDLNQWGAKPYFNF